MHFLYAAHLLRELVYVHEEMGRTSDGDMIKLLLEAKSLAERHARSAAEGRRAVVGEKNPRGRISGRYCEIVLAGLQLNPDPPPPPEGRRGRETEQGPQPAHPL